MPRNSSGTYSLPAGNPVVTGTLIETNWANPTMSDIGSAITDSLDRFGRGGMLAQLKLADGTLAAPAFAFNSEASTGLYRPAAATLNVSVLGTLVASFTNLAITLAKATTVNAALTVTGLLTASGGISVPGVFAWNGGTAALPGLAVVGDLNTGFYSPSADVIGVATNGLSRAEWSSTGSLTLSGTGGGVVVTSARSGAINHQWTLNTNAFANFSFGLNNSGAPNGDGIGTNLAFISSPNVPLVFGVAGAERVRFDSAGFVGINGAPSFPLDIFTATVGDKLRVRNTVSTFEAKLGTSATSAYLDSGNVQLVLRVNGTEREFLDLNGNFGFNQSAIANFAGYTTVEAKGKSGGGGGLIRATSSDAVVSADFSVVSAGGSSNGSIGTFTAHPFLLTTGGTEKARLDTAGRFGIGRTPTTSLIEVAGSASLVVPVASIDLSYGLSMTSVVAVQLGFNNTGLNNPFGAPTNTTYLGNAQNFPLVLTTVGTERARIDTSGAFMVSRILSYGARYKIQSGDGLIASTILGASSDQFAVAVTQAAGNGVYFIGARNAVAAPDLQFSNNAGTQRFVMTDDGRFYGSALHNNPTALTGTGTQYVGSGTTATTFAAVTNVTSVTNLGNIRWSRTGNVVTMGGSMTVTPSAAGGNRFTMTLPIASTIAGVIGSLSGTFSGLDGGTAAVMSGKVTQDAVANIARFDVAAPSTNAFICQFIAIYEIL